MTDNIDVVVKESGSASVVASFNEVADAATRANRNVSALQKTLGSVGRSTAAASRITSLGQSAQGAAAHVGNLTSALNSLNNTRVVSNLNSANTAINGTARAADTAAVSLRNLFGAFLGFQAIKRVIGSLIDAQITMQQIHFGLLSAGGSAAMAAKQFEFLRQNAQTLGIDLKSSAQEFTRLSAAASAMNVPVEKQQQLYTALSKAATVLHLDQQKVQFATLGLTQMFSKGKIQSEELRRQLGEAVPGAAVRFQKAVMESIKGTNLQGESFDSLLKKGKLITSQFLPELIQALEETGTGWQEASKGMNAEINRLKNAWFELKNDLSSGLFSDVVVATVKFLAEHMKGLAAAAIALGTALAIALAPAAIVKFIGYMKEFTALVWASAGPWGLVAAAIAAVVVYLGFMRDEISLGVDKTTTLGDLMRSVWEDVLHVVSNVSDFFSNLWSALTTDSRTTNERVGRAFVNSADTSTSAYSDFYANTGSGLAGFLTAVAKTADAIVGFLGGAALAAGRSFMQFFSWIYNELSKLQNKAADFTESFVNNLIDVSNKTRGMVGLDPLAHVNIARAKVKGAEEFKDIGVIWAESMDDAFSTTDKAGINQWLQERIKRAQEIGKARKATGAGAAPTGAGGDEFETQTNKNADAAKKAKAEMDKLKNALANLIGEIDPTQNALKKLSEAQELLNKVMSVGTPEMKQMVASMGGVDAIMERLRQKYKDQLDPVGALVDKYREERQVLEYVGDEQKVQAVVLQQYQDLKKKNYNITRDYVEQALRPEIEATMAATRANEALNQVIAATVYAQRSKLEAIKAVADAEALYKNSGGKQGITEGQGAQAVVGIFGEEAMKYTAEYAAAQLQIHKDFFAQVQAAEDANLISHQTANMLRAQSDAEYTAKRLGFWSSMFGQLATLSSSSNKKLARIGKAAALVQAVIDGVAAVQKAWASAPYPYNIPAVAVTTIAQAANVASIASQDVGGFRTGGNFQVGGSGGPDSQLVQFYATPGENVSVNTPAQARALENSGGGQEVTVPVTVVNVKDPREAIDAMGTAEGKRVILNHMQSDPAAYKRALGIA